MFRKRELPVYLFTGILESGKSSFIRDTLEEGQFADGDKTLYLMCEEGIEECSKELLEKNKVTVVQVEDQEELTEAFLKECTAKYRPDRIMIENNGMWNPEEVLDVFPNDWMLVQVIATVDATTFPVYLNNMKALLMNQLKMADLVIFNRCDTDTDRASFRRSVKALNRQAQIMYEAADGVMDDEFEEELPFDVEASMIDLEDDDFGLWYLDAMDNPEKYKGKTVRFTGQVYRGRAFANDLMVPGRFAMTCCADDIAFIGFMCHAKGANRYKQKEWIKVTATVAVEYCKDYKGEGPVLYATEVVPAEKPEEELVYFT